jgi:O-antigen/teichoic acid export membrane protein
MILALVVWDRSEFILLKYLCPDIRQIAFYSVAFSMGERLLIGASIFTSASNATIFAQYGRDKSRLPDITAVTFRYLVLISFPLHIIASGLAIPVLLLLYGKKYIGATTIVALAPLLCMPKAFMAPVRGLLESTERQGIIVWATVLAGAIDVAVAWALIPRYGAVGAGIGSGMAQMTAVGLMWAICIHLYKIKLPWFFTVKMLLASIASALVARTIAIHFPPLASILLGGTAAVFVLLLLMYLTSALTKEDRDRLDVLTTMLPGPVARTVGALLPLFTRTGRGNAVLVKS